MLSAKAMPFVMVGALAVAGCARNDETKTTTTTETKTVGSTQESTTKTTVDTPAGETKSVERYGEST